MLYLDNAATTPLQHGVFEAMLPYLNENFFNPSSVYKPARQVRAAIDEARQIVADVLNAAPNEIFFTSGGTEADNWAIKGALEASKRGRHIVTTATEHHGILYVCKHMEKQGCEVTYLPVDREGFVNPQDLDAAIRPETALVSIMFANNEVGTIQPMEALSEITNRHGVPLHTDAVQAVGHIPIDVETLGVQMLALSAHKFGGPKGIGALYVKKGTPIFSLFQGGAQERNRRAGTENVAGIVGMGAAIDISAKEISCELPRVSALRDRLIREISEKIPHTVLNGPLGDKRLPGNVNFSFRFVEGEALLLHLDMQGCCASTGSACSSGALEPSHVLMSLGLGHELANGALRFSFGAGNTEADIEKLMQILCPAVQKLRALSPLYDDFLKQ
ncbi:MAG: cysteine desulfurase NifS [Defluviitaleaceae bacterium]|nr:cysteine desulfurase NifS [Defluviitaleaceae bacterium]MCL2262817.1 cysteine desulfurase NifS [Defluviitaleaceae bacterium]MCL2263867.1 cysteine desulfurase NifS [Defluviitaleaceae bacterium]